MKEETLRIFSSKMHAQMMEYLNDHKYYICICLIKSSEMDRYWVVGEFYEVMDFLEAKKLPRGYPRMTLKVFSCVHEFTKPWMATRFFLDVEDKTRPLALMKTDTLRLQKVLCLFYEFFDLTWPKPEERLHKECIVLDACTATKLSYHVTFPYIIFSSYNDLAVFINDFLAFVERTGRHSIMSTHDQKGKLIDVGIYSRANATLRMANMYKYNDFQKLVAPLRYNEELSTIHYIDNPTSLLYLTSLQFFNYYEGDSIYNDVEDGNLVCTKRAIKCIYNRDRTKCVVQPFTFETLVYREPCDPDTAWNAAYTISAAAKQNLLTYMTEHTPVGVFWRNEEILVPKNGTKAASRNGMTFRATDATPQFCPGLLVMFLLQPENASIVAKTDAAQDVHRKQNEAMCRQLLKDANGNHYMLAVNHLHDVQKYNLAMGAAATKSHRSYNLSGLRIPEPCLKNKLFLHHRAHVMVFACTDGSVRCTCFEKCVTSSVTIHVDAHITALMLTEEEKKRREEWKQKKATSTVVKKELVSAPAPVVKKAIAKKPIQVPAPMLAAQSRKQIITALTPKKKKK